MRGNSNSKFKKIGLLAVTVFFVLSNFYFLAFFNINSANAQFQVVSDPLLSSIQLGWKGVEVVKWTKDEILNDLKATFFKNVVANFARNFARSSAQWIVTGSKGGKPYWETNVWQAIKDQGQASFEDWLTGAISAGIGLNLCEFDPTLTLNIALTLPNKPDKIKPEGFFGQKLEGCSFQDLKDRFSTDGKEWQDFIKIKTTDIGPDFRRTIDQIARDVSNNQGLRQNNAGVSGFTSPTALVLKDLTDSVNKLGQMSNELDNDMTLLIDKRGTADPVALSVGTYVLVPEVIPEIKAAWRKKISSGAAEVNTRRGEYKNCINKDLVAIRLDPCATYLTRLGYQKPAVGDNWINENPQQAQVFLREVQVKLETTYKLYNSMSNGYASLTKFVNNKIKPAMFQSAGLYTYEKAKTQFQPQADPATQTSDQVKAGAGQAKGEAEERKKTEVSTTGGWKNSVDKISGYIKTPADLLKAKSIESLTKTDSAGEYTKSIIADSLGIFLNELYNLYTQQLLGALSNPKQQKQKGKTNLFSKESQSIVTEDGVNLYYESLSKGFNYTLPDLDLLQEFQTTIVGKRINPNIYNNVIDLNFALAIDRRLSIQEAIDQGKINGGLRFAWTETLQSNTLNLSNIRKLRKARVVPLGLELAAELIRDCNYRNVLDDTGDGIPDYNGFLDITDAQLAGYPETCKTFNCQRLRNCFFVAATSGTISYDVSTAKSKNITMMQQTLNATLDDVLKGFDQRGLDGVCAKNGQPDQGESPFCNLVDPEWILKIPATKCLQTSANEAYGEILQDNTSGQRYARCADFASCLKDDTSNSCASAEYGVCVKEQNVWRLGADSCEPQFDSCSAYTITDSKGKDMEVAYLKNTLDPSNCSADTIGCKGYIRAYDSQTIYFNRNVQTCEIQEEGCHEFISDPTTLENYPTLPAIYDENVLATRVYYRINPLCEYSADPNCAQFMPSCTAEQVGCASFQPLNGDPAVAAVLQPEDQCQAECNGFSAFFRQPTSFDLNSQITFFVPNTATVCQAASVGCAEFTNLEKVNSGVDVAEALEYYTNLRQCIKPGIKPGSDQGEKIFYTWQSIAKGPQQVIKHVLQSITAVDLADYAEEIGVSGAPATYDHSGDCRTDLANLNYCLKFYDANGTVYFRDIRKTILVSDQYCYPLRKTKSTQANCQLTNGTWDASNNYCVYNAYVPQGTDANVGFGQASQTCARSQNNCYNYLGASGHNVFNVFYDDFEPGEAPLPLEYATDGVAKSSQSLISEGHSLQIANSAIASRYVNITSEGFYVLEFIANGAGLVSVRDFGDIVLTGEGWNFYTVGPVKLDSDLTHLVIDNLTGAPIYVDNINLIQYKANYYLIENSWSQVGCSLEDLNCSAYTGPNNRTFYIRQFSNLCPAEKVGCQFLLDTQNTNSPSALDFNNGLLVPADNKVAYVVDNQYKCAVEAKGCEKFSEPILQSGTGLVYDEVIKKNDPERYQGVSSILCSADADGCTELINEGGYPEYYKVNPLNICIYAAPVPGLTNKSGWIVASVGDVLGCNALNFRNEVGCLANIGTWNASLETCTLASTTTQYNNESACADNGGVWLIEYNQCAKPLPEVTETNCVAAKNLWVTTQGVPGGLCAANPFAIIKVSDIDNYQGNTGACPPDASGCSGFQTIKQNSTYTQSECSDIGGFWLSAYNLCSQQVPIVSEEQCVANDYVWTDQCVESPYGQTYYVVDNQQILDRSACTATDWNKGCVAFKNSVSGVVETVKVQKDRDCAEWVDCTEKDPQGNCIMMSAWYRDVDGNVINSKEIIASNYCSKFTTELCANGDRSDRCQVVNTKCVNSVEALPQINVLAQKDGVRYEKTTGGAPRVVTRKTYITRFDNASDRWDVGDYSGYTLPDRFPVETELAKQFVAYPKEKNEDIDLRFLMPVCKIFANEDAPVPNEILRKSGYNKIVNVYSPTVSMSDVADACNYDQAESQGVTTYFPFGYLSKSESNPRICTGKTAVNGTLCTDTKPNDKTFDPACRVSSEVNEDGTSLLDSFGTCNLVENIQTNFGVQSRCLEMDMLNPLYANIQKGTYACLSYFPFQYDECGVLGGNKEACQKLPYCTFINGTCVGDICSFHKDKTTCETEEAQLDDGSKITKCIWDGANKTCLIRKCSLSGANEAGCGKVASYCKFYGNKCIEDICSQPYANMRGDLNSHPEYVADLCMNPTPTLTSPPLPATYNPSVYGSGDYCTWQMKPEGDKGRYTWWCQLKCEIKYPSASNKKECDNDPFCKWANPICYEKCQGKNFAECLSDPDCGYLVDGCVDKCKSFNNDSSSVTDNCTSNTICTLTLDSQNCQDVCAINPDQITCNSMLGIDSAPLCAWIGAECVDICQSLDVNTCTPFSYNDLAVCTWQSGDPGDPGTCVKNSLYDCSNEINSNESTCGNTMGCYWNPQCYNEVLEDAPGVSVLNPVCPAYTTETSCDTNNYCDWGLGSCVTQRDVHGCADYKYSTQNPDPANSKGRLCRAVTAPGMYPGTNDQACDWAYRDWPPRYNFCFPRDGSFPYDNKGWDSEFICHLCQTAPGYNVCDGLRCP